MAGTVVITGPRGGLASLFVSSYHAKHPEDHLILLLRDPSSHSPLPPPSDTMEHLAFDMQNLSQVKETTTDILGRIQSGQLPSIKAIVASAAVQVTSPDQPRIVPGSANGNEEGKGMEETITVNHLAHLSLILGLLPGMAKDGRIVIVGSDSHRDDYEFFKQPARYAPLEEILYVRPGSENAKEAYDRGMMRYGTSKLLQIMAGHELASRLRTHSNKTYASLRVAMYDPGSMGGTGLFRDQSFLIRTIGAYVLRFTRLLNWLNPAIQAALVEDSAAALLRVVDEAEYTARGADESSNGGAPYYEPDGSVGRTFGAANDVEKRRELWVDSVEVLGVQGEAGLL